MQALSSMGKEIWVRQIKFFKQKHNSWGWSVYPNWIQRDIADHMNTMLPISKKSRLAQIRDKGTRKIQKEKTKGGSTSNENWKQNDWHVGEKIMKNSCDKLT